jgi:hypothetical protein
MSNPNVPAIQKPTLDPTAVAQTVMTLTEGVNSLAGQSGAPTARAVTFDDLIALGLVRKSGARLFANATISPNIPPLTP